MKIFILLGIDYSYGIALKRLCVQNGMKLQIFVLVGVVQFLLKQNYQVAVMIAG